MPWNRQESNFRGRAVRFRRTTSSALFSQRWPDGRANLNGWHLVDCRTGYLGDVGTEPPYPPGDFSAWFEAYLGGQWYAFDPRNNVPRIGKILIAQGRDAADVAIRTTFGPNTLECFRIWTDEVAESPV